MTPETLSGIVYFLIANQQRYKQEFKSYSDQQVELVKTEPLFYDEIKSQYRELLTSLMINDITKAMGVSSEDALSVLEDLNFEEYFNK